jgi:precorrin-6B methylase 1
LYLSIILDDTAAISFVCDQIIAGRISNESDIIYVRREDGRQVAKLISAPGLDGTKAYVLEESTEAPPKTTRKTLKSISAQIKNPNSSRKSIFFFANHEISTL